MDAKQKDSDEVSTWMTLQYTLTLVLSYTTTVTMIVPYESLRPKDEKI
jgi:hypothetical protein